MIYARPTIIQNPTVRCKIMPLSMDAKVSYQDFLKRKKIKN